MFAFSRFFAKTICSMCIFIFQFLLPLPKGDGYEFYFCQFNGKDVYFTPLSMYQV